MSTSRQEARWAFRFDPDLTTVLRGYIYTQPSHEMPSFPTLRNVRGLRQLIFTLFYLILLTSPVLAYPRVARSKPKVEVMEDKDRIILRTTGCKPLSHEQLKARMGAYFDETKMRAGDMDADLGDDASSKRDGSWRHSVIDDDDIVQEDSVLDSYSDQFDITRHTDDATSVHNIKFMRRKRDLDEEEEEDSDSTFLYQNLLYETIMKRKSRQKRSSSKPKTPWTCQKENRWKKMKKGYFPSQILDGKCSQKSCFFHQYKCTPVKYALKVLKRDPTEACNPVPLIGNNTTYEESWVFKRIYVTVACECSLPKSNSRKDRGRKRG